MEYEFEWIHLLWGGIIIFVIRAWLKRDWNGGGGSGGCGGCGDSGCGGCGGD